MNDPIRDIPICFDDWSRSLDAESSEDRAALATAARNLLRSPVVLRVLASLERDAIAESIMASDGPDDLFLRMAALKAAFRVRASLKRLADDADLDQSRADTVTRRLE